MFQPIKPALSDVMPEKWQGNARMLPSCETLNKGFLFQNHNQKPLKFVCQDDNLPYLSLGYEQRIFEHGLIATRKNNWHDFFNAMVWKTFPSTKSAINAIHSQEIKKQSDSLRSNRRDILTLFDECGIIVIAEENVTQLIKNHHWHDLFIKNRQHWLDGTIKVITFGHAMYEKYLTPYIGMTAKALLVSQKVDNIDKFLATKIINDESLIQKRELLPLPVLGIPNWYEAQNEAFYANKKYFR